MLMHIHDSLQVEDLKERFRKCFPGLKMEFYYVMGVAKEPSTDKNIIPYHKRVGEIRNNYRNGELLIKSWYTVARVKKDLKEIFGLNAEIFRNENGKWVKTTRTDKYPLNQHMKMVQYSGQCLIPALEDHLVEYDL